MTRRTARKVTDDLVRALGVRAAKHDLSAEALKKGALDSLAEAARERKASPRQKTDSADLLCAMRDAMIRGSNTPKKDDRTKHVPANDSKLPAKPFDFWAEADRLRKETPEQRTDSTDLLRAIRDEN